MLCEEWLWCYARVVQFLFCNDINNILAIDESYSGSRCVGIGQAYIG